MTFEEILKSVQEWLQIGVYRLYFCGLFEKTQSQMTFNILPKSTKRGVKKDLKQVNNLRVQQARTSVVTSYAFLVVFAYLIGLLYQKRECVTSRSNSP